ncbi:hypothetical protein [Caballeronia sp. S22]|uniref:hypothetical protein n=1 Tax=Caballeronia sp. S22 TaxID=3137182 RepID=UPI0035313E2E
MTINVSTAGATQGQTPESLLTLAEYLELSLDVGGSLVMVSPHVHTCAMYVGNPVGSRADLRSCGMIEKTLADEIVDLTHAGVNRIEVDGQVYRFIRRFAHISRRAVVVFDPM